nr:hypothetical protein [Tanacetum cinerariifolium]
VLVTKPHNKIPYELLLGRTPSIGFMRPFGCPVTILNTLDPLVVARNQPNSSAGIQEHFDVDKAGEENVQQYVLFPLWSTGSKDTQNTDVDATFEVKKPKSKVHVSPSSSDKTKKHDDKTKREAKGKTHVDSAQSKKHDDKTKREAKGRSPVESLTGYKNLSVEFEDFSVNNINEDNAVGTLVPAVGQLSPNSTNTFSAAELEDITYSDDEDDVGAEVDFNNLETSITNTDGDAAFDEKEPEFKGRKPESEVNVSPSSNHHVTQIIGDLSLATQTRSMTRVAKDQGGLSQINNDDFHTCIFACFLSQEEPKRVHQALKDQSWIEAMQEELLQFKMQKVWVLVDLPHRKRAIVARIEAIRLFLAYASFMRFMVYQMDVKSAFLYGTIEEEVYVCQPPGFKDPNYPDKVYKVVKALYGLHQAPRPDRKSASTPIDTEKPLLKDPDGEDLDFKKQTVVATSSTEAENVATASCRAQVLWIPNQLLDYGYNFIHTIIYIDNSSTIVNIPRCDEDMLELMELTVFLLPSDEKVRIEVSAVDLQVSAVRLILLLLVQKVKLGLVVVVYRRDDDEKPCINNNDSMFEYSAFVNDVMRLQALVDKKKVVIMEATLREALYLDDAEGIECLPNEEIFAELARMGYEKPSTKITFYKAFFSSQWKFLIHTILQCMSAKRTSCNEFSLSMASVVICLFTGKGYSRVETPLFERMIVEQQVDESDDEVYDEGVPAAVVVAEGVVSAADDVVPTDVEEPSIPSPTPPTPPPQPSQDQPSTSQGRIIADMDADKDVILKDAKEVGVEKFADVDESADVHGRKADMQDDDVEPAELQEVLEVVTTAKLITEVVTAASATINVAAPQPTTAAALTLTTAPSAAKRRKGIVIRDHKETAIPSTIIHSEAKSKDKDWDEVIDHVQRKQKEDNAVKRYQALKRKPQTEGQARKNMMIYLRNVAGFKMDYFKGMNYDDIRPIFEKHFDSNVAFLQKTKEQMDEEDNRALKRLNESQEDKAAKKKKLDEETKATQANEIDSLKRRVKKLEKKQSLGEDASKQGRISDVDADEGITLVSTYDDAKIFDADQDLHVSTATTTPTILIDEVTLAQALAELKHTKPNAKLKRIVFHEPEVSTTTKTTTTIPKPKSQDKGKAIMIEEPVKLKKDQIMIDEEVALKLQAELHAEFDKEQRLAREKAQKEEEESNIALIEI